MNGFPSLHFLTRWIHIAAMSVLLGGSIFLWVLSLRARPDEIRARSMISLLAAEKYEGVFWAALGLLVLTGVGNLGAFGAGLPGTDTPWGQKLALKLGIILLLILFSLLRTLLVARLRSASVPPNPASLSLLLRRLYAATTLFGLMILFLAVSLAHG